MKISIEVVTVTLGAFLLGACAITVPQEMKLSDPNNRKLVDHPGHNIDSMRLACAQSMLNASPATEAVDIQATVVSSKNPTIVNVDAVLLDVGFFKSALPVTYRCQYSDGYLTNTNWTRGLK